jgi:fimbrial chaperone protein
LGFLASAAVIGPPPMPAHAGSFSISPVRLDLSAQARSAALTVRNDEREALIQAEVMVWEQVDGQDRLTPTRDLLVSPAVFTLATGSSQLVRVALRSPPADSGRELSYRLILQEVPQPANPDFSGLQLALRLSVPVFLASSGTSGPALDWSATTSDEQLVLTARNTGDVHARIHSLAISPDAGGDAALARPVATYILPGQSQRWTFGEKQGDGASAAGWSRLRLKVTTDDGESEIELDTSRE